MHPSASTKSDPPVPVLYVGEKACFFSIISFLEPRSDKMITIHQLAIAHRPVPHPPPPFRGAFGGAPTRARSLTRSPPPALHLFIWDF